MVKWLRNRVSDQRVTYLLVRRGLRTKIGADVKIVRMQENLVRIEENKSQKVETESKTEKTESRIGKYTRAE